MESIDKKYSVRWAGVEVGQANTFGEAKALHKEHLPADLLPYYMGLDCSSDYLKGGLAYPVFCSDEMPDAILEKYNLMNEVG